MCKNVSCPTLDNSVWFPITFSSAWTVVLVSNVCENRTPRYWRNSPDRSRFRAFVSTMSEQYSLIFPTISASRHARENKRDIILIKSIIIQVTRDHRHLFPREISNSWVAFIICDHLSSHEKQRRDIFVRRYTTENYRKIAYFLLSTRKDPRVSVATTWRKPRLLHTKYVGNFTRRKQANGRTAEPSQVKTPSRVLAKIRLEFISIACDVCGPHFFPGSVI